MLTTINTDGSLKTTTDVVSGAFVNGGFAYKPDGSLYVVSAGATLTNPFYTAGLATTAEGALYVTSDAPGASAVMVGGVLCRADGAVHIGGSGGYSMAGLPVSAAGLLFATLPIDVRDSDGNSFTVSQTVRDSDGNSFTVTATVRNAAGTSFSVA